MRGDSRRQAGGLVAGSIRLVEDERSPGGDPRIERPFSKEEASQLAEVMAELTYLDHLEAVRESNVASLRRLKNACDALLESRLGSLSATLPPDASLAEDELARQ
jgi:hypothetical protein